MGGCGEARIRDGWDDAQGRKVCIVCIEVKPYSMIFTTKSNAKTAKFDHVVMENAFKKVIADSKLQPDALLEAQITNKTFVFVIAFEHAVLVLLPNACAHTAPTLTTPSLLEFGKRHAQLLLL